MSKTITTGTKITFKETGDKFSLILTDSGFDIKAIKLSKNIQPEPYLFNEFLEMYENGQIIIDGFEETDEALVKSILTNYIHTTEIVTLKADIERLKVDAEQSLQLKTTNQELVSANEKLTTKKGELEYEIKELKAINQDLNTKNEKLNTALEAMQEQ